MPFSPLYRNYLLGTIVFSAHVSGLFTSGPASEKKLPFNNGIPEKTCLPMHASFKKSTGPGKTGEERTINHYPLSSFPSPIHFRIYHNFRTANTSCSVRSCLGSQELKYFDRHLGASVVSVNLDNLKGLEALPKLTNDITAKIGQ